MTEDHTMSRSMARRVSSSTSVSFTSGDSSHARTWSRYLCSQASHQTLISIC